LSKATIALLYFDNFYSIPLFISFQPKDEYFEKDTWMLIPDGNIGVVISFTDEDIMNANIAYNEEEENFNIQFLNQNELADSGYENFNKIEFCYLKKAL
jgi:hypothetical protein